MAEALELNLLACPRGLLSAVAPMGIFLQKTFFDLISKDYFSSINRFFYYF